MASIFNEGSSKKIKLYAIFYFVLAALNMPMAFTEHGVLMLSSVLKSQRAVDINIQIVRIFTKMRKMLMSQKELLNRVLKLEHNLEGQSYEIKVLFEYLKKLMNDNEQKKVQSSRVKIGYKPKKKT